MNQVWLALITGLTTGGVSCFAVQGGLLASALANQPKTSQKSSIITFLIVKLVAYSFLGALLGLLGSALIISAKVQGYMQIIAGLFMLLSVGKLLDLHPVFRSTTFTPPKSVFKLLRSKNLNENTFAPALLGFLTILIPCGITQSMMLLAVASASPIYASLILGAFVLGTSPVFFGLGIASTQILQRKSLKYLAVSAILILALISINTGQVLRGSIHTFQNYRAVIFEKDKVELYGKVAGINNSGKQDVEITVSNNGYQSSARTLKVGVPVNLSLITKNTKGCSRAFTIPEYNITRILAETGIQTVEFTPSRRGRLTYTCSMGMYTGYFEVI